MEQIEKENKTNDSAVLRKGMGNIKEFLQV